MIRAGLAAAAIAAMIACSKTQDTTPQTRIFGRAPNITDVHFDSSPSSVSCDYTEALTNHYQLQMLSPVLIGGTFSHFTLAVTVADPDATGKDVDHNDILLVSANFVDPNSPSGTKQQDILILFDDGSVTPTQSNKVLFMVQTGDFEEDCTVSPAGGIQCVKASIPLSSGDSAKDDGIFTRKFAIVNTATANKLGNGFFFDCVAYQNHEFPAIFAEGANIKLTIQAVDDEGNLTTSSDHPSITVQKSQFACSGDPCACCILALGETAATDPNGQCRGLDGMIGRDQPDGFCNRSF